jgi:hypothetical protein
MTERCSPDGVLDAGFIGFEVRDGIRRISCTVSNEALNAVSALSVPSTAGARRKSFDRFRMLINAAAWLKLRTLPPNFAGPLALSTQDLRRVPPEVGMPTFGSLGPTA